jgi:hypothetical protein
MLERGWGGCCSYSEIRLWRIDADGAGGGAMDERRVASLRFWVRLDLKLDNETREREVRRL